ncbi:hypothetical protein ONS95_010836 [Cadophora gregata]|uniref:uncharacterized protein n=1 Tax=Cadophora gregata TaxID=51156 RepID=UPI0026DB136D|nr:uncharacterized protein ONS95_010836 [Cadophora gregata]KAK0119384.1 hypothetical protein ONS95_010836 [Cadophora gregata]KAK0120417.1 hypothetical protein ONS96_010633 [Cadophora gregata f. sp. sojae]
MSSADSVSNPFNFKGGDVKIKVKYKGEEMVGMVATQAMVLASPVWEKFIFPPWSNESSKVKEIDFSGDDGEAMLILLNIAHLQFCYVPNELHYLLLYQIAILCEQYDCHAILKPWLESWLKNEPNDLYAIGKEEWIYIAWAFGRENYFRSKATLLLLHIELHQDGSPFVFYGTKVSEVMPDKFLENIMVIREAKINEYLNLVYKEVDRYMHGKNTVCGCVLERKSCDAALNGALVLELGRAGLWPRISAKDYKGTLYSLRFTIQFLDIHPYQSTTSCEQRQDHSDCGVASAQKKWVDILCETLPNAVLDCHTRHMKMRNGTATRTEDGQDPRCVRCNTYHVPTNNCPPNPRKRPAE